MDFLNRLERAAPMKIVKLLTDSVLNAIGLLPIGNSNTYRSRRVERIHRKSRNRACNAVPSYQGASVNHSGNKIHSDVVARDLHRT